MKFHENWGEFTAKDVRHAVFLITQPESVQTDAGFWRPLMGIGKADTIEDVARKVEQGVEIIDDYKVVFHLTQAAPEFVENISANTDLVMESKARWDAGGKELYGQKVVGTGPFEFVERKVSSHVLYKRVENHWRKTPEYKELEFRWVPEGVTRLATLIAEEVHISDVDRALQKDAVAKGMQIVTSKLPAIQHQWNFGGMYFATPDKLDPKVPFVKKEVRQAMNMAINRNAIANSLLGGRVQPPGSWVTTPSLALPSGLGSGILSGISVSRSYTVTTPPRQRRSWSRPDIPTGSSSPSTSITLPGLPEQVDIGQALALDWQAIGLKPKLVEIDFPRVRELFRTKTIHGAVFPTRHGLNSLETIRILNKAKDSVVYSYEHPFIEQSIAELGQVLAPAERARLLREIGDHKFTEFAEMPTVLAVRGSRCEPQVYRGVYIPGGDHRLLHAPGVRQAGAVRRGERLCRGVVVAALVGVVCAIGLVVTVAWAQTPLRRRAKLERLRVAVAPLGYDTNFTWLHRRSGHAR